MNKEAIIKYLKNTLLTPEQTLELDIEPEFVHAYTVGYMKSMISTLIDTLENNA